MSDNPVPPLGFVRGQEWDGVWRDCTPLATGQPVDYAQRDLLRGTYLDRVYRDKLYRVYIGDPLLPTPDNWATWGWGRFWYAGRRYRNLTAIAREITGDDNLSGHRFFGLRRRRRGAKS